MQIARFVRNKDFEVALLLQPEDVDRQNELIAAIFVVKPSLLIPRVTFEVYQPVVGDVANTIFQLCRDGVASCSIKTLTPDRPYPHPTTSICGHIEYFLRDGHVSFHENCMNRDAINGDDFMVHVLQIDFETMKIRTNRGHIPSKQAKQGDKILRLIPSGLS